MILGANRHFRAEPVLIIHGILNDMAFIETQILKPTFRNQVNGEIMLFNVTSKYEATSVH